MAFTRCFDCDCQAVLTQNTRRFFCQMSQQVWAVMIVTLPSNDTVGDAPCQLHKSIESVSEQVMGSVLNTACQTFELFNGKVSKLLVEEGAETLKKRLEHFFHRYLRTMLFEHCDLLDCFNSIQFTAVEPGDFARVQGFLNRIKYAFPCIQHVAFFYDGRLVQSTLKLDYARHIYHYLNSFLFIEQPDLNHTGAVCKTKHLGRFVVGPKDLSDTSQTVQCPVLCSPGSDVPDSQLITYQALRTVVCFIVRGVESIPMNFFVQFDAMAGPRLTILADRLASSQSASLVGGSAFQVQLFEDQFNPNLVTLSAVGGGHSREDDSIQMVEELAQTDTTLVSSQGHSRFVYWNPATYAVMSTLHVYTGSGRRPYTGAKPILEAMTSMRMELLQRPDFWHQEITIRLDPNLWVIARRSNEREVYMVFIRKQENLSKLDKYVEHLYASTFRGLLLLD
ncbi:Vacuolar fusion protein CCZ1 [Fasciola hepatica]|uniref:Vacuolar fusion protein CCZ1 n=1 Tax=Fasciola hepatica TaxID=6192 RepID=A0A4E0QVZ9_FASHE|nr:Vacuolar fusion protein CCZ1 [Fasciola hepatica]